MPAHDEGRGATSALARAVAVPLAVGVMCLIGTPSARRVHGQQARHALETIQLRPNFYVIAGAGANVSVHIGSDGVVLVDAGRFDAADDVLAAIRSLTAQPIRYIIDTGADADHVGGNGILARAGRSIFAMGPEPLGGEFAKAMTNGFAASILASEGALVRMSAPTGRPSPFPSDAWPTETFVERRRDLYLNGEGIQVFRQPAAHSDSDSIVFFRGADIVAAGDVLDATRFPVITWQEGGSIQGEIDALNHIIDLSVRPRPLIFQQGGTYVVPGHGRIYDQIDVVEYRDMVVTIRDIVADMIERGLTMDQVVAAQPAKAFAPQYGSTSGLWTTDEFVRAVYTSLTGRTSRRN